jgi:DNA replication protein DnaC
VKIAIASIEEHFRRLENDPQYRAEIEQQEAEDRRRVEEEERQERERSRRWEMEVAGIPRKDVERLAADELHRTKALEYAQAWYASGKKLLVLSGGVGIGKTTALGWLASREWPSPRYRRPGRVRFIEAFRLRRADRFDDKAMLEIEGVAFLAIDDIGSEYSASAAWPSFIDGLVNYRYAAELPTAMSTNLTAAQFKAAFGARVADRMREVGTFVEIAGESLRGRK